MVDWQGCRYHGSWCPHRAWQTLRMANTARGALLGKLEVEVRWQA